jgi:hypothetical protein
MNNGLHRLTLLAFLLAGLACVTGAAEAHGPQAHAGHGADYDPPFHGGVVLEFNDQVHYEIVALADGELQIWFGDIHRRPMAASEVTDVAAEVDHADKSVEPVDMSISRDGSYWTGKARLRDPADVVRVGFIYRQESATGSVSYASLQAVAKDGPAPHRKEGKR